MNHTKIVFEMSQADADLLEWFDGESPVEIVKNKILDRAAGIKRAVVEGKLETIAGLTGVPVWQMVQEALEAKVSQMQAEHGLSDEQVKPRSIRVNGFLMSNADGIAVPEFVRRD